MPFKYINLKVLSKTVLRRKDHGNDHYGNMNYDCFCYITTTQT